MGTKRSRGRIVVVKGANRPKRVMLITATDPPFNHLTLDYDDYSMNSETERPFLQIYGYKRPDVSGRFVKSIEIVYLRFPEQKKSRSPEPYTMLLSSSFESGLKRYPVCERFPHLLHEKVVRECKERRRFIGKYFVPTVYGAYTLISYCGHIWNEYCVAEGMTSIGRMCFCAWIYRLTSLATDLLDYPIHVDPEPGKRRMVVATFLKHESGREYECYYPDHWQSVLAATRFTPQAALNARLRDACEVHRRMREEIKPVSLLERFLLSLADSFYGKLRQDELLKRCPVCHSYFPYDARKKRCSLVSEGRNCAKKAHNRRDYLLHRRGKLLNSRR